MSQLEEKNVTIEELEDEENVETVHERIIEIVLADAHPSADTKQESEAVMIEVPEGFVNKSSAIDVNLLTSQPEETRDAEICVAAATKGEELLIPMEEALIDQTALMEKAQEITMVSSESSLALDQKHIRAEKQMVSAGLEADQETVIKEQIESDVEQILSKVRSSTSSRSSFSSEEKRLSNEEESQLEETSKGEICATASTKAEELQIPIEETLSENTQQVETVDEIKMETIESSESSDQHLLQSPGKEKVVITGLEAEQETDIKEQAKSDKLWMASKHQYSLR